MSRRVKQIERESLTDQDDVSEPEPPEKPSPPADPVARMKAFKIRTASTVTLIALYIGVLWGGHVPLMFLMYGLQHLVTMELFKMARVSQKERKLPGFRAQQWFFFFTAVFWLYLRFIKNNLLVEVTSTQTLARLFSWVLRHHSLISYSLYMAGFVMFVLSLKRGMYMYQFNQYAWTHMILLITTVPSSFFISNIFSGIIWYALPAFLIVGNDIFAYLAGFFFGRTPLIKLSPKKTWEGFVGGFIGTAVLAFFLSSILSKYKWMTCPRRDLTVFGKFDCDVDEVFLPTTYTLADLTGILPQPLVDQLAVLAAHLPEGISNALANFKMTAAPIQLHAIPFAVFASLVAPFGGFFASGIKRAMNLKDFGDTIPGHGGVTDRFDCQLLMAIFSYVYYWSYISKPELSFGDVLSQVLKLNDHDQVLLFAKLGNLLVGEGLIPGKIMDTIKQTLGKNFTMDAPNS